MFPRIVIAGMAGNSGKTLISLSILSELYRQGIKTAVFKKGPDFIDSAWLGLASHTTARNLDIYLMGSDYIYRSFVTHAVPDGINVIEGNRGLYDGIETGEASTAELAKILKIPVILVCSPVKVSRTAAALVLGCQRFDPDLNIAAVILNRISGVRHENVVKKAIEEVCGIPVLGVIPKLEEDSLLPKRHLGLVTPEEAETVAKRIDTFSRFCKKYIDLEKLLKIARLAPALDVNSEQSEDKLKVPTVRIGYFFDSAFTFYYPENLEALNQAGAELIKISALHDKILPEVDALYIGGGFPETHAELLESNISLLSAVKDAAESGMPIYAECGGLIYLSKALKWNGKTYRMAGVFPIIMEMQKKPQGHGYCEIKVDSTNPFFPKEKVYRGHEFHYTRIVSGIDSVKSIYAVNRGVGCFNKRDGLLYKNVLAGYTHLHAGGMEDWANGIVKAALKHKRLRRST